MPKEYKHAPKHVLSCSCVLLWYLRKMFWQRVVVKKVKTKEDLYVYVCDFVTCEQNQQEKDDSLFDFSPDIIPCGWIGSKH